jgi:sensor histidine kinase YesM
VASSIANYVHERFAFVIIYSISFIVTSLHLFYYHKKRKHDVAARVLVVTLFSMFFSFFFIGEQASFDILWVLILPIVTVILGDFHKTKLWLITFNLLLLAALGLQLLKPDLIPYESFAIWSMLWAGIFLSGMSLYYKKVQAQLLDEIRIYQEGLEGKITHATNAIETLESEKKQNEYLLMQSRLSSLETQLNPHFLFNALNSIAELIHIDSYKAEEAILKVSSFLRNTMEEKAFIMLSDELRNVKEYIALENIRFDGKIKLNVLGSTPVWDVPKFSIQLIIENAIKHGMGDAQKELNITITFKTEKKRILICNDGLPIKNETFGIGLGNLHQRLQLLCQGQLLIESKTPPCYAIELGEKNENIDR